MRSTPLNSGSTSSKFARFTAAALLAIAAFTACATEKSESYRIAEAAFQIAWDGTDSIDRVYICAAYDSDPDLAVSIVATAADFNGDEVAAIKDGLNEKCS